MSLLRFLRRARWDAERSRELEAYLEAETAANIERGMTVEEAAGAARRKLGNPTQIREEIYRMNSIGWLETLWRDLRYAARVLGRSPGFTTVAVLSLALGIGANTAIFSLVYAVLLRPLPYPQADRMVRVGRGLDLGDVNVPQYEFWKRNSSTFAAAAAHVGFTTRNLVTGGTPELLTVTPVTDDFLRTLGVAPALGREFTAEETRAGGGSQAILLTDRLWRRSFAANPAMVGRAIVLDNTSYTVVGILPRGFWFPQESDAFVPLRPSGTAGDTGFNIDMIARLKPGVSLAQARAEMAALSARYPRSPGERVTRVTVMPYHEYLSGEVRLTLLLLLGAVALLLLMACGNVAGLALARLAARRKEIALRLALGGGMARLLQQFLAENLLLGAAGSLAGLLVARYSLRALLVLVPFHLPASAPIRLDVPVLCFTLAIAIGAALLFGLAPSVAAVRLDVNAALKLAGRSTGSAGGGQRARAFLVVGQVALSTTLLVGAALLLQSLYRMHQEHLGFTPAGLITFRTPPRGGRKDAAAIWAFESAAIEKIQRIPGVRGVAAVNILPLTSQGNFPAQRQGHAEDAIGGMEIRIVTPGYFETMRTALIAGRAFTAHDTASAPPVILVNETVARRWWKSGSPLGDLVEVGRFKDTNYIDPPEAARAVVGVVADTKSVELKAAPRPTVYLPAAQAWWFDQAMSWVVRADLSPGLAGAVRSAVAQVDPQQRVTQMRSMEDIVAATTADSRFDAWLFGSFAGLALLLASVGVYGLLSFSVAGRTAEFGTRMALGATRRDVSRLVLRQGLGLIGAGLALGLAAAFAMSRWLASLLFGVKWHDTASFAASAGVLLAVGLAACFLPALRAMRVDPMTALRYE